MDDAVFRLLDRVGRTHTGARRIFAVHTHHGSRLCAGSAIDELEMNHGPAAVRIAFHARLHACLAADAP
jgi:creatinine amidohydrolase/Fe(II)-dependent formamide hydrolase-like protein